MKEVASKTSDVAGDGTTIATVLAQAIFANVIVGTRDRDGKWTEGGALGKLSKSVDEGSVAQVGAISAKGEQEIGEVIAGAKVRLQINDTEVSHHSNQMSFIEGGSLDRGICCRVRRRASARLRAQ